MFPDTTFRKKDIAPALICAKDIKVEPINPVQPSGSDTYHPAIKKPPQKFCLIHAKLIQFYLKSIFYSNFVSRCLRDTETQSLNLHISIVAKINSLFRRKKSEGGGLDKENKRVRETNIKT